MSMNMTLVHYVNTFDKHGEPIHRPAAPGDTPDGTYIVFTDRTMNGDEYGVKVIWTDVIDEVPEHILDTVEEMMRHYRRKHV